MKVRKLKVYEAPINSSRNIPCIRLQGKWLKELGFLPGKEMNVKMNKGRILIELIHEAEEEYDSHKK
ncbi:Toxin SymE, type I toxin-antitoxin system [Caminicella sporogenes DSM 14501]|uniref:Toxin SymE, type I toxin-antitoxin system n=1 Tax=Caminicella sporogenes DSM 14501 TaxID=1121266 RepID=A0A1M6RE13_9FIRM|nr:SymE family type I addiction module toxin [Caminicella sporogenes]RKD25205.1 hypothetical protein BET04_03015 [Caminicella sporogenes]SHK30608.1 Toxin SymE, type I toxin-antitoxin system [Caminicella sporogenes DSM 14501]